MDDHKTRMSNALRIMVTTPHIRRYLEQNDPMALKQAEDALIDKPPLCASCGKSLESHLPDGFCPVEHFLYNCTGCWTEGLLDHEESFMDWRNRWEATLKRYLRH